MRTGPSGRAAGTRAPHPALDASVSRPARPVAPAPVLAREAEEEAEGTLMVAAGARCGCGAGGGDGG